MRIELNHPLSLVIGRVFETQERKKERTSYTPLPGVMTALALRTSDLLDLVVEFHAVCRCTICGAQADSEARIPGITMTACVDIFTNTVSNPQTPGPQPKFPNQICDSHPD